MVVGLALAAVQMGMALPTGFLFGVGYGTGVRVGYEQVYPLLFPKGARPTTTELAATMKGMNTVYDAIGGKDASRMGIAVGITNAGEILNNPDFRVLEALESSLSGPTSSNLNRSRYGLDNPESSPQQVLSSEIAAFNKLTGSQKWARYRSFTNEQLLNIRSFSTTDESGIIAGQILSERHLLPKQTSETPVSTANLSQNQPSSKVLSASQDPVYLAWIAELGKWKAQYQTNKKAEEAEQARRKKGISSADQSASYRAEGVARGKRRDATSKIRAMSNQYRHVNNHIRENALRLRANMSQWTG